MFVSPLLKKKYIAGGNFLRCESLFLALAIFDRPAEIYTSPTLTILVGDEMTVTEVVTPPVWFGRVASI